jgi:hypothetical protein
VCIANKVVSLCFENISKQLYIFREGGGGFFGTTCQITGYRWMVLGNMSITFCHKIFHYKIFRAKTSGFADYILMYRRQTSFSALILCSESNFLIKQWAWEMTYGCKPVMSGRLASCLFLAIS